MIKEYILYVDDTGFNSSEKKSQSLKDEQVSYAGVLVEKELSEHLSGIMQELGKMLNDRYKTTEFHFTEIYNRKDKFKDIQFEETLNMLEMFADLFNYFDLKIFVHTRTKGIGEMQNVANQLIDEIAPIFHLPKGEKTQALFLTYFSAKKYIEENFKDAKIVKIVCDEGLRKNGAEETINPQNVKVEFKSSKECSLLQLADFGAWYLTRTKHILDKVSSKGEISEADRAVLSICSKLEDNYKNLSKLPLNLDKLKDFNYDKEHEKALKQKEKE